MTPFSSSPELTLRIVGYAIDEQTTKARHHAQVRRAARRGERAQRRTDS